MPERLLLPMALVLASALVLGVGKSPAAAETHDLARFEGTYQYAGGDREIEELDHAIDDVVRQMNFLIRGIARRRLRAPNLPSKEVRIVVVDRQIRIIRPGQPEVSAPADGTPITWKHPTDGDVFRVSHGIDDGGALYQRFEGEQSISLNRFVLSEDGKRLTIHTEILADRLPAPLRFKMTYERRVDAELGALLLRRRALQWQLHRHALLLTTALTPTARLAAERVPRLLRDSQARRAFATRRATTRS